MSCLKVSLKLFSAVSPVLLLVSVVAQNTFVFHVPRSLCIFLSAFSFTESLLFFPLVDFMVYDHHPLSPRPLVKKKKWQKGKYYFLRRKLPSANLSMRKQLHRIMDHALAQFGFFAQRHTAQYLVASSAHKCEGMKKRAVATGSETGSSAEVLHKNRLKEEEDHSKKHHYRYILLYLLS